ncbi:hypothetical protein PAPYR_10015 [Paratrimastix pyriformis]|uniref:Uncharacterized protein n=1 Tax=Paratrimastix pyriformis TaxID=342808 RepID=A0ABQ8U6Y2_9EUKA|nr:hypothetical protein PAPYR_10015 [Paratrimastix pyriformis]
MERLEALAGDDQKEGHHDTAEGREEALSGDAHWGAHPLRCPALAIHSPPLKPLPATLKCVSLRLGAGPWGNCPQLASLELIEDHHHHMEPLPSVSSLSTRAIRCVRWRSIAAGGAPGHI